MKREPEENKTQKVTIRTYWGGKKGPEHVPLSGNPKKAWSQLI